MDSPIPVTSSDVAFMDVTSLQRMAHNKAMPEQAKIEEASRQFEGVLVKTFLKDALKPMFEGYLDESGSAQNIYRHFVTDVLSDSISKSGALGMSSLLQAKLHVASNPESTQPNEAKQSK